MLKLRLFYLSFILPAVALVSGCNFFRHGDANVSGLAETPIDYTGEGGGQRAIRAAMEPSRLDQIFAELNAKADRKLEEARAAVTAAKAQPGWSPAKEQQRRCQADPRPVGQKLCADFASLPPDAQDAMTEASRQYATILNSFSRLRQLDWDLNSADGKWKPDAQVKDFGNCTTGNLPDYGDLDYALCADVKLMAKLYDMANGAAVAYGNGGSQALLKDYVEYFALADAIKNRLSAYEQEAMTNVVALNNGLFDSGNSNTKAVPYLAVVGHPSQFKALMKGYFNSYVQLVEKSYENLAQQFAAGHDAATSAQAAADLQAEIDDADSLEVIDDDSAKVMAADDDFRDQQVKRIETENADAATRAVLGADAVFGKFKQDVPLTSGVLAVNPQAAKNSDFVDVKSGPSMIELTAPAVEYKSNGIYAQEDKVSLHQWGGFLGQVADKVNNSPVGHAVGEKWNSARDYIDARAKGATNSLDNLLQSVPTSPDMGPLGGILSGVAQLPSAVMKAAGLPYMSPGDMSSMFQQLQNGGLPALKPIDTTKAVTDAWGQKVPYPAISTHVYGEVTGPAGYATSKNIGNNLGVNTGANRGTSHGRGESAGVNVGLNAGISVTPFGVGISAGINGSGNAGFSANDGVSDGDSFGASNGTSVGRSIRTGFFHPLAKYPQLRVGMLVAELYCDGALYRFYPIGPANVIKLSQTEQAALKACSVAQLRVITNDHPDGSSDQSACDGPCASDTTIAVSYKLYQDDDAIYNQGMAILSSPDFDKATAHVAYSADPYGAALAYFHERSLHDGMPPDALPKFDDAVRGKVTYLLNLKKLDELAQDNLKSDLERKKIEHHTEALKARARLLKRKAELWNDADEINRMYQDFLAQKAAIEQAYVTYYVTKMRYWFNLYVEAKEYQSNADTTQLKAQFDATVTKVQQVLATAADGAATDAGTPDPADAQACAQRPDQSYCLRMAKTKKALADQAAKIISEEGLGMSLNVIMDGEDEQEFVRSIVLQERIGHCQVDLTQYLADMSAGAKSLFFNQAGARTAAFVPAKIQGSGGQPQANTVWEKDKACALVDFANQQACRSGQFQGPDYYRLPVDTDITKIFNYDHPLAANPNGPADMRCSGLNRDGNSIPKILGMAFTYVRGPTSGSAVMPQKVYLEHDKLMDWTVPSANGENDVTLYRMIDYWSFDTKQWQMTVTPDLREVGLVPTASLNQVCQDDFGSFHYTSSACVTQLLGEASPVQLLQSTDGGHYSFALNFFNSYLGGKWFVYVPTGQGGYDQWTNLVTRLYLNVYYAYDVERN